MYSFYLFEWSVIHTGSSEWSGTYLTNDANDLRRRVVGAFDDMTDMLFEEWNMTVQVYQRGELSSEHDVLAVHRITIPDFAELRIESDGTVVGGEPLPGSEYEHVTDREQLFDMWADVIRESDGEPSIRGDWTRIDLPALMDPILPTGADAAVDGDGFLWGDVRKH
ncbi:MULTISPECIES: hypothetical protein [unclassified Streptomyces]|uniref:hypothetical protein n=1 Tax=unclassified Streptomyces TaxID=2593676 RepID=UPI0035D645D9